MSAPIRRKIATNSALSEFNEAARKLKNSTTQIPVVRKLKPPPEIWELVPVNEPKRGDVFPTRPPSGWRSPVLLVLVIGVVAAVSMYVWSIRSTSGVAVAPVTQHSTTKQPVSTSMASGSDSTLNPSQSAVTTLNAQPTLPSASESTSPTDSRPINRAGSRVGRKADTEANGAASDRPAGSRAAGDSTAAVERSASQPLPTNPPRSRSAATFPATTQQSADSQSNNKSSGAPAPTSPKTNTALAPQLSSPPKTSSSPKAKVIQWP